MERILSLFFFTIQASYLFSQAPIIQIDNRSMSFPILSSEEIDRMQSPAEGFVVMNKTTNCINYYLNNSWYQLCGSCLPETSPFFIDSVVQKNSIAEVYFRKHKTDILHIICGNQTLSISNESSPIKLKVPFNNDTLAFIAYVSNKCYTLQKSQSFKFPIRRVSSSAPKTINIDDRSITVRNISGTWWMCDDWLKVPANLPPSQRLVSYSENMCPSGWKIPIKKDWQQLMDVFESAPAEILEKPTVDNSSISISLTGAYATEEKRMIGEGSMGSYWVGETDSKGKQYLINITQNGYMFVAENKQKAKLNLRCVKYE